MSHLIAILPSSRPRGDAASSSRATWSASNLIWMITFGTIDWIQCLIVESLLPAIAHSILSKLLQIWCHIHTLPSCICCSISLSRKVPWGQMLQALLAHWLVTYCCALHKLILLKRVLFKTGRASCSSCWCSLPEELVVKFRRIHCVDLLLLRLRWCMLALLTLMMLFLVTSVDGGGPTLRWRWQWMPWRCATVICLLLLRWGSSLTSTTMPIKMGDSLIAYTSVVNTGCCMHAMLPVVRTCQAVCHLILLLLNRIMAPRELVLHFGWLHIVKSIWI